MKKIIGSIGVDSGSLLITDPCHVKFKDPYPIKDEDVSCIFDENGQHPKQLGVKLPPIDPSNPALMYPRYIKKGVVVPTLYGDGEYDIKANYNKDGKITSITIKL